MININVEVKGTLIILIIKNYYNCELHFENNNLLTTKKNEMNQHGYGIKSIRCIAKEYGGDIKLNTENNIFTLIVYFYLK